VRRLALLAVAALACRGNTANSTPGPLDRFFYPTGLAVLPVAPAGNHRLVVVSSNADLTYASDTGGSVISVNPEAQPDPVVTGALNIRSFGGELALAYRAACPALPADGPGAAVVPIRGEDVVYRLDVGPQGEISCSDPTACLTSVGTSQRGDPWSAGVACDTATSPDGARVARAYVGYLRESLGLAWLTQIDLLKKPSEDGYVQHSYFEHGQIRGMAYDASRRRLYLTQSVVGASSRLMYYDLGPRDQLGNPCRIDVATVSGGCPRGGTRDQARTASGSVPFGLELRGIALANETDTAARVRRAYVSARIYDPAAAQQAGNRVGDFDGLLLVVDLSEDATGNLVFDVVDEIPIGYGASDVRVLPPRPGKRDVVAALAADDAVVWIYDDETGGRVAIGRDPGTGTPRVGKTPWGLAVAPEVLPGTNVARVYAGSFQESFVTPIEVPLDDPAAANIVMAGPDEPRRIGGGVR
jgi:hypothetical protein